MRAETLCLTGATLHFETRGEGPLLLCIAGGNTDADLFAGLAEALEKRYTVVTYDPRGNSRSPLDGAPSDLHISLLADDARALLKAVGGGPALVFGSSSGALTGLDLLVRFPEAVRQLVAHEPPMFSVLPDAEDWDRQLRAVRTVAAEQGIWAGMRSFASLMGLPAAPEPQPGETEPPDFARRMADNSALFLAHEMLPFTRYRPDLSALQASARVVLAVGMESSHLPPARPAHWLADHCGLPLQTFPGDHVGYALFPQAFAQQLDAVFRKS